jgi:hypothetical protein
MKTGAASVLLLYSSAQRIWRIDTEDKKTKNYSTEYSHVVPHHSTDSAISCLTAQIGRDAVLLTVYGRNSKEIFSH